MRGAGGFIKTPLIFLKGAFAVLLCVLNLIAQDKYALDLSLPGQLPRSPGSGLGYGPRLSGGDHGEFVQPTIELALHIVSLDKSTYALGEDLVCQIRFNNMSTEAVRIPRSPNPDYGNKDRAVGKKEPASASLTGWVTLLLKTDPGITRKITLPGLYGGYANPETYRMLDPGESASVKLKGRIVLTATKHDNASREHINLPESLTVTAAYDHDGTTGRNPFATVRPRNHAGVAILEARRETVK